MSRKYMPWRASSPDLVKFLYCMDRRLRFSCPMACEDCELQQKTYQQSNLPAVCFALAKLLDDGGADNER